MFDGLPVSKDGTKEWEEAMSGADAIFPSEVTEIDDTEIASQSANGSRFVRVVNQVKGVLKGKK